MGSKRRGLAGGKAVNARPPARGMGNRWGVGSVIPMHGGKSGRAGCLLIMGVAVARGSREACYIGASISGPAPSGWTTWLCVRSGSTDLG